MVSNSAIAQSARTLSPVGLRLPRPSRNKRKSGGATAQLPWTTVALKSVHYPTASSDRGRFTPPAAYVWWLAAAAVIIHGLLGWYITTHIGSRNVEPKKSQLSVELVRPKPPEPKIEPPKPTPPKPQIKRPAQVLPPIQQAEPQPTDTPAAISTEAPIAIAPVTSEPAASVAVAETAPVGGAGYLNNPPPDYPTVAVRQGWSGVVTLRVHVLSTGKVDSVEVQKSSGRRVLDEEALRTVKNWLFTPAKRGDTAIDGWANVPIEFSLEQ